MLLYLRVPDCDALYARAVAAGCNAKTPLQDMFWGDRYSLVEDPYCHLWEIATTIRDVNNRELQEVVSAMNDRSRAESCGRVKPSMAAGIGDAIPAACERQRAT